FRHPTPQESYQLPGAFWQGLMAATPLLIEALRGTQDRQKGQRPDAVSPGEGHQQHTREPAQATDFDKMGVGGPHGITVDAFGFDLIAASTLNGGFVRDRCCWRIRSQAQAERSVTGAFSHAGCPRPNSRSAGD